MIIDDESGLLIQEDFQYEFNGLLFGKETKMKVDTMRGLRGLSGVRGGNIPKPGRHGSFPTRSYYEDRVVSWDMWLLAGGAFLADDLIDKMGAAFQLTSTEIPFVMKRPKAQKRRLYCKVTNENIDAGYELSMGYGTASVELTAADPFWYSNSLRTKSLEILGGASSQSMYIQNFGKAPSDRYHIVIQGPVAAGTNITCAEDGTRQLKLLSALLTDQTMVIDGYNHDATIYPTYADYASGTNGVPSYNFTRTDSGWFSIQPGVNQIVVNRVSTTGTARAYIYYRDAWAS